ncbi:MAG TPA: NAD(P)-dependent glycerol-3-phosphate dehydrogenase [Rhodospirillales bacterium]|nr:NAD(P)-dependent glycerol-3-phosphate dehydrogenase [Rhodospirillales bacterium]
MAMVGRRAGLEVTLWALEPEVAEAINTLHENTLYLPGVALDESITATNDLAVAADADALLLVVPTQFLRAACTRLAEVYKTGAPLIICAKGIEQKTHALPSEVVAEVMPGAPLAILSGPTFAAEVAREQPTAVTLASQHEELSAQLPEVLGSTFFRVYSTDDIIGAQLGGAVKNVLAIACGVVEGRRMGDNARAALITRGLSEIAKLALAKGAKAETLMGLSGLGDLILTCSAMQSRNFSLGVALGKGEALKDILAMRKSIAEGVFTASSVCGLARDLGLDLPICQAVDGILNHAQDIDLSIAGLLARPTGEE